MHLDDEGSLVIYSAVRWLDILDIDSNSSRRPVEPTLLLGNFARGFRQ